MSSKRLTVVGSEDAPEQMAKRSPSTIASAVKSTERDLLVALRAKAAAELDAGVPAHTMPQLMKQLRELDKDIRAIDARSEDDGSGTAADGSVDTRFDASAI